METLIRCRLLIWDCTVCQLSFLRYPDYNGLTVGIITEYTVRTFNHICIFAPGSGTSNLVSGGAFIAITVCSSNDFILRMSWYVTYANVVKLRNTNLTFVIYCKYLHISCSMEKWVFRGICRQIMHACPCLCHL